MNPTVAHDPALDDCLRMDATGLGQAIAAGQLTCVQVVDAHIARCQAVNPPLNALIAHRFDLAREEAAEADELLHDQGPIGPLHGVPCTLKSFFCYPDMPWDGGTISRKGMRGAYPATVARRLEDAGAIVLGVTNVPEGGIWYETNNPLWGRTNNPHDLYRTCGGSSGGEGALIAAGGSPLGIGSDSGGSIRIPAHLCGVAGHKPSGGLVPNTGHFPPAPAVPFDPMVSGPLARSVRDCELALEVITGPDGLDQRVSDVLGPRRSWPDETEQLVVYRLKDLNADLPVKIALERALLALEDSGATVRELELKGSNRALAAWGAAMAEGDEKYLEILQIPSLRRAIANELLGRHQHAKSLLTVMLIERLMAKIPGNQLARLARSLRAEVNQVLAHNAVLLHPVMPCTAPLHRATALLSPLALSSTALFNVTESPVTVVPVMSDDKGLPIGIQIASARGQDRLTLAVGRRLEQALRRPFVAREPCFGAKPRLRLIRG